MLNLGQMDCRRRRRGERGHTWPENSVWPAWTQAARRVTQGLAFLHWELLGNTTAKRRARLEGRMFFTFPENARWDAELQAVEFGVEIGAWKYAASRLERNGGPEDRRRPRE